MKHSIIAISILAAGVLSSCDDFIYGDSDLVTYSDDMGLSSDADSLWSVVGIFRKVQAVADRTILLGEVRGDLTDLTSNADADLQALAAFEATTDNKYNRIADYYAIINNCNFFLDKANTELRNNRGEYIFRKEYAAVKSFRAWTYLQLALIYGRVPFITEPVVTQEQSEQEHPMYDLQQICNYFINDIAPYADVEMPEYGTIGGVPSKNFYYPIKVLLGDLCLWSGKYREAAQHYYRFLTTHLGVNKADPVGTASVRFAETDRYYERTQNSWGSLFNTSSDETLTIIPGDEFPREGCYSELRDLFNTNANNEYKRTIIPSDAIYALSQSQTYCHYNGSEFINPPTLSDPIKKGDLRLSATVSTGKMNMKINGTLITDYLTNNKQQNRHTIILRRTMVYLRMAEALCRAGFPHFAFQILKSGVNNNVIENDVKPYYSEADQAFLSTFDFPNNYYVLQTTAGSTDENTMGIHARGCGYSANDVSYNMPEDPTITDPASQLQYQIEAVEDLIANEEALECAFEGQRYYDLMRVAMRRGDTNYLASHIYARSKNAPTQIKADLRSQSSWYLPLPKK